MTEDKEKQGKGFIINQENKKKIMHEINDIFRKYNLNVPEIALIMKDLNEAMDATDSFAKDLVMQGALNATRDMIKKRKDL